MPIVVVGALAGGVALAVMYGHFQRDCMTGSPYTTCAVAVPVCATVHVESWNRFTFSWDISQCRLLNAMWDAKSRT